MIAFRLIGVCRLKSYNPYGSIPFIYKDQQNADLSGRKLELRICSNNNNHTLSNNSLRQSNIPNWPLHHSRGEAGTKTGFPPLPSNLNQGHSKGGKISLPADKGEKMITLNAQH